MRKEKQAWQNDFSFVCIILDFQGSVYVSLPRIIWLQILTAGSIWGARNASYQWRRESNWRWLPCLGTNSWVSHVGGKDFQEIEQEGRISASSPMTGNAYKLGSRHSCVGLIRSQRLWQWVRACHFIHALDIWPYNPPPKMDKKASFGHSVRIFVHFLFPLGHIEIWGTLPLTRIEQIHFWWNDKVCIFSLRKQNGFRALYWGGCISSKTHCFGKKKLFRWAIFKTTKHPVMACMHETQPHSVWVRGVPDCIPSKGLFRRYVFLI